MATVSVDEGPVESSAAGEFAVLREAPELATERRALGEWLAAAPDKTLALVAQMDDPAATPGGGPVLYACPMHPEVTSDQPGRCPKCGMNLLSSAASTTYACPMHPEVTGDQPGRCPKCGMKLLAVRTVTQPAASDPPAMNHTGHGEHEHGHGPAMEHHADPAMEDHAGHEAPDHHGSSAAAGIEWEDDMVEVNRQTTAATMHWTDRTGPPAQAVPGSTGSSLSVTG